MITKVLLGDLRDKLRCVGQHAVLSLAQSIYSINVTDLLCLISLLSSGLNSFSVVKNLNSSLATTPDYAITPLRKFFPKDETRKDVPGHLLMCLPWAFITVKVQTRVPNLAPPFSRYMAYFLNLSFSSALFRFKEIN